MKNAGSASLVLRQSIVFCLAIAPGIWLWVGCRQAPEAPAAPALQNELPILFEQEGLRLPEAKHTRALEQAPVILANAGHVVVEGIRVGRQDDLSKNEGLEIADLAERLDQIKNQFTSLHPDQPFEGRFILQMDRETPARVVARVLATCHGAGYARGQLATQAAAAAPGATAQPLPRALHFTLVERKAPGSAALPGTGSLQDWARELDAAAAQGAVTVHLAH